MMQDIVSLVVIMREANQNAIKPFYITHNKLALRMYKRSLVFISCVSNYLEIRLIYNNYKLHLNEFAYFKHSYMYSVLYLVHRLLLKLGH